MRFATTALTACAAVWLALPPMPCGAQGAATLRELAALTEAAEMIGASTLMRGTLESLLGPAEAKSLLALAPDVIGLRVIQSDRLAGAVATSPAIRAAGQTDSLVASFNALRLQSARVAPPAGSGARPLALLSVSEHAVQDPATVDTALAMTGIARLNGDPTRRIGLSLEGIKVEPGYKVPLWSTRAGTSGDFTFDKVTWPQVAIVTTAGCAALSPCQDNVTLHLQKILGTVAEK